MSFISSSGSVSSPQSTEDGMDGDGGPMEAFYLGASFVAVLICLVIIRFAIIAFIDCCYGEDYLQRRVAESFRRLCPWWHRRTQPFNIDTNDIADTNGDGAGAMNSELQLRSIRKGSDEEFGKRRRLLVNQLLPSRILKKRDLDELCANGTQSIIRKPNLNEVCDSDVDAVSSSSKSVDGNNETSDVESASSPPPSPTPHREDDVESGTDTTAATPAACCSICIQELMVGQAVCQSKDCGHWFHADCLRQWVVRREPDASSSSNGHGGTASTGTSTTTTSHHIIGSNHCPNCRSSIVPQQALDDILGLLRRQELSR